jgi:hypothetical protein
VDPLVCPNCGAEMKCRDRSSDFVLRYDPDVIAIIENHDELRSVLRFREISLTIAVSLLRLRITFPMIRRLITDRPHRFLEMGEHLVERNLVNSCRALDRDKSRDYAAQRIGADTLHPEHFHDVRDVTVLLEYVIDLRIFVYFHHFFLC